MLIINRRRFIQQGTLASATLLVPKFLKAFERKAAAVGSQKQRSLA